MKAIFTDGQSILNAFQRHAIPALLLLTVLICIGLAFLALLRPIQAKHYAAIVQIDRQAHAPRAQRMAHTLLAQSDIPLASYLKLVHAYQTEQLHQQQYPALDVATQNLNLNNQPRVE